MSSKEVLCFNINLTQDEYDYLSKEIKYHDGLSVYEGGRVYKKEMRCECGHLWALHSGHCCSFCMVPGCECEES